ncbi:MAG: hypothetical protein BGO41_11695 [Clostridiales bacterium 38-18]|nr:MAG: hypothetical protein BGO41_11695 [Clostridiales bacterium 38-18]
MNLLNKIAKMCLLVFSSIVSIYILTCIIKTNVIIVLFITIFGGGLTLLVEKIANHEFKNSFEIIRIVEKYSHPVARSFWKLGKLLALVIILKIVSVDFMQISLDSIKSDSSSIQILYDSALFTLGIAAIAVMISAMYNLEFKKTNTLVTIKDPIKFSIELPKKFVNNYEKRNNDMLAYYVNHLKPEEFFILCENKINFDKALNWIDYSKLYFENLSYLQEATILQRELVTHNNSIKIECLINGIINKGYYKFIELENHFLCIYIGGTKEMFNKNEAEYLSVISSV